jgi:hypothetical protein
MIYTLNTYLDPESDLFHYDDKPKGVFKEPLVRSTTDAIYGILLSAGLWDDLKTRPSKVTLRFTADKETCLFMQLQKLPIVALLYKERDVEFTVYNVTGVAPQSFVDEMDFLDEMGDPTTAQLCDHLMDYFQEPPDAFYCQVSIPADSTPVPRQGAA